MIADFAAKSIFAKLSFLSSARILILSFKNLEPWLPPKIKTVANSGLFLSSISQMINRNSKIFITPHIASLLDPEAGGKEIAKNVNDFLDGKQVENLIPPGKGY